VTVRFNFESVYGELNWTSLYPNAQGYQAKFLDFCKQELAKSEFPNIDYEIEEFKSGGTFFNIEKTRMLAVSFKKSQFKNLGIYFRCQQFGNVVLYTLMKTLDRGFWDSGEARTEEAIIAGIKDKCKNYAQWEEFQAIRHLGELIFRDAIKFLDPAWEENKHLFKLT